MRSNRATDADTPGADHCPVEGTGVGDAGWAKAAGAARRRVAVAFALGEAHASLWPAGYGLKAGVDKELLLSHQLP